MTAFEGVLISAILGLWGVVLVLAQVVHTGHRRTESRLAECEKDRLALWAKIGIVIKEARRFRRGQR
jgi:hypothetical protein